MGIEIKKDINSVLRIIDENFISGRTSEKPEIKDFEFVSKKEDSRFVPIKITKEEAIKAHECQKVMLNFMFIQYQSSVGTGQEEHMRKLYHDACVDYDEFLNAHKELLS